MHKIKYLYFFTFSYIGVKKVCFLKYGCFAMTKHFQGRNAELPSRPGVIRTKFFLYTRRNRGQAQLLNSNKIRSITRSHFDPSRKTILIVHGFAHHSHKPWVLKMKNELLMRYWYNVISVDWRKGASYLTMSYLKVSVYIRSLYDYSIGLACLLLLMKQRSRTDNFQHVWSIVYLTCTK